MPDKLIYRRIKDKEFNVYFSKDTVKQASELFMKNMNLSKFTLEHDKNVSGINVIESWTVEDAKNDKANLYNLEPKGGEWVLMSKYIMMKYGKKLSKVLSKVIPLRVCLMDYKTLTYLTK